MDVDLHDPDTTAQGAAPPQIQPGWVGARLASLPCRVGARLRAAVDTPLSLLRPVVAATGELHPPRGSRRQVGPTSRADARLRNRDGARQEGHPGVPRRDPRRPTDIRNGSETVVICLNEVPVWSKWRSRIAVSTSHMPVSVVAPRRGDPRRRGRYVEAPVSGSRTSAEAGELVGHEDGT